MVARLRARCHSLTDAGLVNYVIQPGETPDQNGQPRSFYSRINERSNEMVLLTYRPLDYESLPSYTLTVKAAVSSKYLFLVTWRWPWFGPCMTFKLCNSFRSVTYLKFFFCCYCLSFEWSTYSLRAVVQAITFFSFYILLSCDFGLCIYIL